MEMPARSPAEIPALPLHAAAETPEARATRRIQSVLRAGHPVCIAYSAGKDSSALTNLALNAARQLIEEGDLVPPLVVVNADTMVEQPYVRWLADADLAKIKAFGERHGLAIETLIAQPTLSDSFPVRVIGGRALPSFPG